MDNNGLNHKKKLITGVIIFIILLLLAEILLGSKNKSLIKKDNNTNKKETAIKTKTPILYYGNTCPHCAQLEKWLQENKIEKKIKIIKKEVYDNRQNAQELGQSAKNCGLSSSSVGVPFLYVENKCYIGTIEIKNYLSKKAGL